MLYDIELIRKKALRLYENGDLFRSFMEGEKLFPYTISLKKPTQKELRLNFSTLFDEIKNLQRLHLMLEYREFTFKSIGTQKLPVSVVFESEEKFLSFVEKEKEFRTFCKAYEKAVNRFASLKQIFLKRPNLLLQNMQNIDQLLDVVRFFSTNSRPNIYIRELSIRGVDTKFIQKNRVVVDALLLCVLDESSYDASITKLSDNGFEKKYGLKYELPLVRFRILDEELSIHGLNDISLTTEAFLGLNIACENVFIVENKITMLSFPQLAKSIVIFGNGYGVGSVKEAKWMHEKKIFYWGDIDMDGFAILSQARGYFPHIQSLFMDTQTLEAFQDLAVVTQEKSYKELKYLTEDEALLYERLFNDYYDTNFRLEQERVPFAYIKKELDAFR